MHQSLELKMADFECNNISFKIVYVGSIYNFIVLLSACITAPGFHTTIKIVCIIRKISICNSQHNYNAEYVK